MSGWIIGFLIGAVIVVIVVVLLLVLIALATRIGGRAEAIVGALHAARDHTTGLAELTETNRVVTRINAAATTARESVEGAPDE